MPTNAPPILCKHPMLDTLEALAKNHEALTDLIRGIRLTGDSVDARLERAEETGLLERYAEGQRAPAHDQLRSWGTDASLLRLSNALGDALELVRTTNKPLRAWWLAGATDGELECAVRESNDSEAVYFLLLTPPMTDATVASKGAFDTSFLNGLKDLAAALKAFTDGF